MTSVASSATLSAVIAAVPAAEQAVGRHRASLDPSAGWGVPAHVTVLVPFVPPALIDAEVLRRAAAVAARLPVVDVLLDRVGWFDDRVAYLAPEPAEWFRTATARMYDAFPDCPPYDGAFDDVVPHLTIGDRGDPATTRAAVADVERALPITAHLDRLIVVCGSELERSWRTVAELPLFDS